MKLHHKLLLLTITVLLLPVMAILVASGHFGNRTLQLSVETTTSLASSDLRHIVEGAVALADSNVTALRLQRETAVKNYLRSLADDAVRSIEIRHRELPKDEAWERIRQDLLRVRIGESGYIFGLDSAGRLTIHPKSEGRSLAGAAHIDEMRESKEGYIIYHSVTAGRDKAVFYRYYEPLDLIVAPGVFLDEMEPLYDREAEADIWEKFRMLLSEIEVGESGSVWVLKTEGPGKGTFYLPPGTAGSGGAETFPLAEILADAEKAESGSMVRGRYLINGREGETRAVMSQFTRFAPRGWLVGASVPERELLQASEQIAESFTALKISVIIVAAITVLIAAAVAYLFARRTFAPLKKGVLFAQQVARGDLTASVEVTGKDEVSELNGALNEMVTGVTAMVRRTQQTTAGLDRISTRLAETSGELEGLSSVQAQRSDETASAIQEINASIREVNASVDSLGEAAGENTASTLELSATIEEVSQNMAAVARSGQEASSFSTELAATSKQIAVNTRHLREVSESVGSSIFQMDAAIGQVKENAGGAAEITRNVLRDAEEGKKTVDGTVAGIRDISRTMESAAEAVQSLAGKTESIGAIVSLIDEVASEINLLALNAAIIAAQAGAEGRGFSVVAEEIKELAGRTTHSTTEISNVIQSVQDDIGTAVSSIRVVEEKTRDGEDLSGQAGRMLEKILEGMNQITYRVDQIAGATTEQAVGSRTIKEAMESVSDMIGQIVQATDEQEKGNAEIRKVIDQLKEFSERVNTSIREQARTSSIIAGNTETMNEMVGSIGRSCAEQVQSSDLIVRAGEDIRQGSETALHANQALTESIEGLLREIETLEGQVAQFRTGAEQKREG